MKTISYHANHLLKLFKKEKIADMEDLKSALGTNSSMTIFRKLKELNYLSSCSHSGKYYTLKQIARFDNAGLWSYKSVLFSLYGTLAETIRTLVEQSDKGYTACEVEKLLNVKPNEPLLGLIKSRAILREKYSGNYVYFSDKSTIKRRQELLRSELCEELSLGKFKPDVLMDEVKAAIIIFFSILDEKQRRLYAGLESLKFGHGGDRLISEMLGLNIKTVAKGRQELLHNETLTNDIRKPGGGRKNIKKKSQVS